MIPLFGSRFLFICRNMDHGGSYETNTDQKYGDTIMQRDYFAKTLHLRESNSNKNKFQSRAYHLHST